MADSVTGFITPELVEPVIVAVGVEIPCSVPVAGVIAGIVKPEGVANVAPATLQRASAPIRPFFNWLLVHVLCFVAQSTMAWINVGDWQRPYKC